MSKELTFNVAHVTAQKSAMRARRIKHCLCVVALVAVLVGAGMLLISTCRSMVIGGRLKTLLTTTRGDGLSATAQSRRRYSTSDEMRYILYGVGDQFSPYDEQLVDYIRSHISQPSLTRPRQLAKPQQKDQSQVGQSKFVDKLLSGRQNGFFIECGAFDGEELSNSLFFELERNWTGLLVEANPDYHRALIDKNRRAYVMSACLSPERRPMTVRMQPAGVFGGIADKMSRTHLQFKKPEVSVHCFPLNAIMAAINVSHVDYLSLDVEGPELEILHTIDWTRLHIDVITVEYRVGRGPKIGKDQPATLKKLEDLRQFFRDTGVYREVALLPGGREARALDVVFSRI